MTLEKTQQANPSGARPKAAPVLLVLLDDVGLDQRYHLGRHTPNLDAMADEGVSFPMTWVANSCSPGRAQVITGQYPFGNGIGHLLRDDPAETFGLASTGQLCARLQGSTSWIGKWHVDAMPSFLPDAAGNIAPLRAGWSFFYGTPFNLHQTPNGHYAPVPIWEQNQQAVTTEHLLVEEMHEAAKRMRCGDALVVFAPHYCHEPREAPPAWMHTYGDLSGASDSELALAMLEAADTALGNLLRVAGRCGYTVIATTDNGSPQQIGGAKGTLREANLRAWMHVTGSVVPPVLRGNSSERLVQLTDFYATIFELVEGRPMLDPPDGSISFADAITGQPHQVPERGFLYAEEFKPNGLPAPDEDERDRVISDGCFKLWLPKDGGSLELYDMLSDPAEEDNLLEDGISDAEQDTIDDLTSLLP